MQIVRSRSVAFHNGPAIAIVLAIGWFTLFGPVYVDFAADAWRREENAHMPFLAAIIAAFAYSAATKAPLPTSGSAGKILGGAMLAACLALFAFARIKNVDLLLSALQGGIALSLSLMFCGAAGVKRLWFPLALTAYLIVWPGWLISEATLPLKLATSELVANMLFVFGLPVAHEGAVISAGPYRLLVADACAGVNSLIALTSVGFVYLFCARRTSPLSVAMTAAAIVPIALLANALRVALLVLITYYLGYDAGQSFLHDFAGLLTFALALGGVFLVDAFAVSLSRPKRWLKI